MLIWTMGTDGTLTLERFYEQNYEKMLRLAVRWLNNEEKAKDAVQTAFLSILENFSKYSRISGDEMTALCKRVVVNKALDMLRHDRFVCYFPAEEEAEADLRTEPRLLIEAALNYYAAQGGPPEIMIHKESREGLLQCLAQLSREHKQVLVLRYYGQKKPSEIAGLLRLPVKTVEQRLFRAKRKLKQVMEGEM